MDMRRVGRAIGRRGRRLRAAVLWSGGPARRTAGTDRVPARSTEEVLREHLQQVVALLSAAGVEHFAVPSRPAQRPRVGVPADQRDALAAALRGSNVEGLFVQAPQLPPAPVGGMDPRYLAGTAEATVFTYRRVGSRVEGPRYGCDIELWDRDRDGVLHAPRPNPIATVIPPAFAAPATMEVLGARVTTLAGLDVPDHADDVAFDIDLVYTWVDGSDPAWQERQRAALQHQDPTWHPAAANAGRYLDRQELRYSLRSVELYADFFRTIFIVTDDQVPVWLDVAHPRIRIVDHREIFGDPGRLPTFNSHAIESRLHHIDGLAEHFVYANDDMLFGRPVPPHAFFAPNGISRFLLAPVEFGAGPVTADDNPAEVAAKNNRDLLAQRFGRVPRHKLRHSPYPLRRSVLDDMEAEFPEQFAATAASQFRHPDDISVASNFFHYYAYFTQRAVPTELRFRYVDISATTPRTLRAALARIQRERPDVYCVNDVHGDVPAAVDAQVASFFAEMYPAASSFEKR